MAESGFTKGQIHALRVTLDSVIPETPPATQLLSDCVALFLNALYFPIERPGDPGAKSKNLSAPVSLELGKNLFSILTDEVNADQHETYGVIVGVYDDGSSYSFSGSHSDPQREGAVRIAVSGTSPQLAKTAALRLWSLFQNQSWMITRDNLGRHSEDAEETVVSNSVDVVVHRATRSTEPSLDQIQENGRAVFSFRVAVLYTRNA